MSLKFYVTFPLTFSLMIMKIPVISNHLGVSNQPLIPYVCVNFIFHSALFRVSMFSSLQVESTSCPSHPRTLPCIIIGWISIIWAFYTSFLKYGFCRAGNNSTYIHPHISQQDQTWGTVLTAKSSFTRKDLSCFFS